MQDELADNFLYQIEGITHRRLRAAEIPQLREATCPICMADFLEGTVASMTRCGHIFHYHCLVPCFFRGSSS